MSDQTETSPFVRLFSNETQARLVDVFLRRFDSELTVVELAEAAGVERTSVYRNIDTLVELGLVEEHQASSGTRYRLDTESPVTQSLGETHRKLVEQGHNVAPPEDQEEQESSLDELLPQFVTTELLRDLLKERAAFRHELFDLVQRHIRDDVDDLSQRVREAAPGGLENARRLKHKVGVDKVRG